MISHCSRSLPSPPHKVTDQTLKLQDGQTYLPAEGLELESEFKQTLAWKDLKFRTLLWLINLTSCVCVPKPVQEKKRSIPSIMHWSLERVGSRLLADLLAYRSSYVKLYSHCHRLSHQRIQIQCHVPLLSPMHTSRARMVMFAKVTTPILVQIVQSCAFICTEFEPAKEAAAERLSLRKSS